MNFEQLANEHKDAVYRQMLRVCGNREDAEDVLIEALLNAYRNLDQLRDVVAFRSWLAMIGKRVCWRLRGREALLPLIQLSSAEETVAEIADTREDPENHAIFLQMKDRLAGVLNGLEPEYRQVYEMRDLQGMTGDEVARKLGITRAAMKSRLHRARKLVRQGIDEAIKPPVLEKGNQCHS